jgi:hypothetical protein
MATRTREALRETGRVVMTAGKMREDIAGAALLPMDPLDLVRFVDHLPARLNVVVVHVLAVLVLLLSAPLLPSSYHPFLY